MADEPKKVRVPRAFVIDHEERDLPTPAYRAIGRGLYMDRNDPAMAELIADAKHYIDGTDAPASIKTAARMFLKAIEAHSNG